MKLFYCHNIQLFYLTCGTLHTVGVRRQKGLVKQYFQECSAGSSFSTSGWSDRRVYGLSYSLGNSTFIAVTNCLFTVFPATTSVFKNIMRQSDRRCYSLQSVCRLNQSCMLKSWYLDKNISFTLVYKNNYNTITNVCNIPSLKSLVAIITSNWEGMMQT